MRAFQKSPLCAIGRQRRWYVERSESTPKSSILSRKNANSAHEKNLSTDHNIFISTSKVRPGEGFTQRQIIQNVSACIEK
jgi:hypothetical protein